MARGSPATTVCASAPGQPQAAASTISTSRNAGRSVLAVRTRAAIIGGIFLQNAIVRKLLRLGGRQGNERGGLRLGGDGLHLEVPFPNLVDRGIDDELED